MRDIRIQLDCHKTKTRASLTTECLSGSLSCYFLVFVEGLSSWSTEIKFLRQRESTVRFKNKVSLVIFSRIKSNFPQKFSRNVICMFSRLGAHLIGELVNETAAKQVWITSWIDTVN